MTEKKGTPVNGADSGPDIRGDIRAYSEKGRISCRAAFDIAERRGVSVPEVGRAIEDMGIKIVACQLGCFR